MLDPNLTDITAPETDRRLALANWITHEDNPLTYQGNRQPPLAMDLRKWTCYHPKRLWSWGGSSVPSRTPRLAGKSFETKQRLPESPP